MAYPDLFNVSGLAQVARRCRFGTQFTCFTGTKVQILTQKALVDCSRLSRHTCSTRSGRMRCRIRCCTAARRQLQEQQLQQQASPRRTAAGAHFACFTGTKVQILTRIGRWRTAARRQLQQQHQHQHQHQHQATPPQVFSAPLFCTFVPVNQVN